MWTVWILAVVQCVIISVTVKGSANIQIFTATPDNSLRNTSYLPTWDSLDTRPLPQWYDEAKIGIFIHWGVFSVPSYGSEWFWQDWKGEKVSSFVEFMKNNYPPGFTYQDFARQFTAEFFDPDHWAELFESSGAKFIEVLPGVNEYTVCVYGDWETTDDYWTAKEFIAWLYNDSPVKDTVVVNDRWGTGDLGKHGDFYTPTDRFNPGVLQSHKWENCMTIDKQSWGFRRNAKLYDYLTMEELLKTLAETVSCGGNLLMNVGPTKDGIITPIYEERLRGMGKYTKNVNDVGTTVYAIVLNWPQGGSLRLGAPSGDQEVVLTFSSLTKQTLLLNGHGFLS
ncbi:Alpha-L-fucosidase [Blattella germanica]|nr:Alpha-L-fucosidase [Blattella germanica]